MWRQTHNAPQLNRLLFERAQRTTAIATAQVLATGEEHHRKGQLVAIEERDFLWYAVFEYLEVLGLQLPHWRCWSFYGPPAY